MRLTIHGGDLQSAAAWTAAVTPRRTPVPELAGMLLTATEDGLELAATDYDTTVQARPSAHVQDAGRALVSGRLLADVAKTVAKEPDVNLRVDGSTLLVTVDQGRWSLPLMDANSFPNLPTPGPGLGEVDAAAFAHAVDRVLVAVGDGSLADPMRGGVALTAAAEEGSPLIVATTDRYRSAVAEVPWKPHGNEPDLPELVVPSSILRPAITGLKGSGSAVTLHSDGSVAGLSTDTHTVIGRLVDVEPGMWRRGDLPDDRERVTVATFRTEDLVRCLGRASVGLEDAYVAVRFDADAVTVEPNDEARVYGDHSCAPITFTGKPQAVGMRQRALADLLSKMESPVTLFGFVPIKGAAMIGARPADEQGNELPGFRMTQAPARLGRQ